MNDIINQVKALIETDNLKQADVSKQSGVSTQILSPLLKGTYEGRTDVYIDKLSSWLNSYTSAKAAQAETIGEPTWVEMPTTTKLLSMMSLSQGLCAWTMAYEGAGVGKTSAARHYQKSNSNVWIVTASPNLKARRAFLAAIAREMNINANNMTIDRLDYEIMQRITGSNGLLIIDEAQYVTDDVLNGLRILTEERIGVTLLGNDVVRSRMSAPKSRANMYPIWSRILKSHKIKQSTQLDMKAYIKAWGIKDSDVVQWAFKNIPGTTGQIRTLRHLIRIASSYAKAEGTTINTSHMTKAYKYIEEVV